MFDTRAKRKRSTSAASPLPKVKTLTTGLIVNSSASFNRRCPTSTTPNSSVIAGNSGCQPYVLNDSRNSESSQVKSIRMLSSMGYPYRSSGEFSPRIDVNLFIVIVRNNLTSNHVSPFLATFVITAQNNIQTLGNCCQFLCGNNVTSFIFGTV